MNDDELSEQLRSEIPRPEADYWDRIDARLEGVASTVKPAAWSGPAEPEILARTETTAGQPRPMVMNAISPDTPEPNSHRGLFALAAGLVLLVGVVGAFAVLRSDDGSLDVAGDDTGVSTTLGGTTPDTTTDEGAPQTTVATTEASPTTTSSTAPPAPAFTFPNIGNVAFYNGLALGWWDGEAWVEMPSGFDGPVTDPPIFPASAIRYVDADSGTIERTGGDLREECTEVGNMWTIEDDPSTENLIGTSGGWDLRPRPVAEIGITDAHRESVRAVVEAAGVQDPEIVIQRVVRVDVDGDGVDEVLIAAENIESSTDSFANNLLGQPEGAYSMVLLRRVTPEGVETIDLGSYVVTAELADPEDGSFGGFISYTRLADLADLNGDGVFEAVTTTGYYEGGAVLINQLGEEPSAAAGAGCGV